MLAVDRVFRATERYDIYLFHRCLLFTLAKQGIYKVVSVEHSELVDTLADAYVSHRNMELVADAYHNATLGCAV